MEDFWKLQDIIIWEKDRTLPWSGKGRLRNIFEYVLFFTKTDTTEFKFFSDDIRIPSELKRWWVKYPERYNPNGKIPHNLWRFNELETNIWNIPIPVQGTWGNGWVRHFCPFPPQLIERILRLTTEEGDTVLDPFAGSGSVLAQANAMKRKAIGFDVNKNFKKMYEKTVLPEIRKQWENRLKELKEEQRQKEILSDTITKLRKLKYPKDLLKRSIKNGLSVDIVNNINSIFVIKNIKGEDNPSIYFIFDDLTPDENMITELRKTTKIWPLNTYGFQPNIKTYSRKEIIKNKSKMNIPSELYLYSRGDTSYLNEALSFEDWTDKSKSSDWRKHYYKNMPPILSNIELKEKERELKQKRLI